MDFHEKLGIDHHEFRVVFGRTKIEYDHAKESENRVKHGYSLESAVHLLERLVLNFGSSIPHMVSDGFLENGEVRHMHITLDDNENVVLMVTTMRPDEAVRVISFRLASNDEKITFQNVTGYIPKIR